MARIRPGYGTAMRRFLAYSLLTVAVVVGALGLLFALFAGGHEGDALRAGGLVYLALAAMLGIVGSLLLRSDR